MTDIAPSLFGIKQSNRDYTKADTWGKNQFNSSFPAALACYMHSKELKAVYIKANKQLNASIEYISIDELYKIDPLAENTYFAFETQFTPFQKYVIGAIPRNDLVIQDSNTGNCLSTLEIKLTALPDNATCNNEESAYGSEIVIRPDTIVYLACTFIEAFQENRRELKRYLGTFNTNITDWTVARNVLPYIQDIRESFVKIVNDKNDYQVPIVMEPVWKTNGKSPQLAENCLDTFVWSNFGMLNLFFPESGIELEKISRHTRSMVWLYKMLLDYANSGHFDGEKIIDELSYNTKNDKAFSTNGMRTHSLMACDELTSPRILKEEIKNIILGGGQNLLSPERRFDAIIYNSPDLFNDEEQK